MYEEVYVAAIAGALTAAYVGGIVPIRAFCLMEEVNKTDFSVELQPSRGPIERIEIRFRLFHSGASEHGMHSVEREVVPVDISLWKEVDKCSAERHGFRMRGSSRDDIDSKIR